MFQFQNTITIGDVISFTLLIATGLTVLFAYIQVKANYTTQKAAFFKELYSIMYADPDIRDAYLLIEYEGFIYDDHFHNASPHEKSIDRMLSFFDLLCDLYHQKILTEHEMSFFQYRIIRVYQDPHIRKYLNFLHVFYLTNAMHQLRPYYAFLTYSEKEIQRVQRENTGNRLYLSVNQAYVFYEEQKGALDNLLMVIEHRLPTKEDGESSAQRKLRALDMLIHCFRVAFAEQQLPVKKDGESLSERKLRTMTVLKHHFPYSSDFNEDGAMREAIEKSRVYDPSRLIIGLEALKARLLIEENQQLQKDVHPVSDKISMKHLFEHIH